MKRFIRTGVLVIAVFACASAAWAQVQPVELQTLGGNESNVYAVNDTGVSVGWATTSEDLFCAVRCDRYGNVEDLAAFYPTTISAVRSSAIGISNLGQVIRNYTDSAGHQRAFLWTQEGGMQDLGTLGGNETQVIAINEVGQVIGRSEFTPNEWRPFIITPQANDDGMPKWYQGTPPMNELMTDLGPTPNGRPWGGKYSPFGPTALNDQGDRGGDLRAALGNHGDGLSRVWLVTVDRDGEPRHPRWN
jgi:probable HAF family extracellular repeat protein